jgi:alpha-L-rhamnosidase
MKTYIHSGFLIMMVSLMALGCQRSSMVPVDMQVEYLIDPVNLDVKSPCLSWKLESASPELRNLSQKSYQVLVASNLKLLNKNTGDLWNSGIVESSNSTQVVYSGTELRSRQRCYWKVRIWDQVGKLSSWSKTAAWRMALLKKDDWSGAEWIGLKDDTRSSPLSERPFQNFLMKEPVMKKSHPSPLFRKEFTMTKKISNAMAYISGLGYAELYVNGDKASENVLDPGQTNYDVFSLYATHDITALLKKGENVIGIMLGNGFYGQSIGFVDWLNYGTPRLRCKIWIEYSDGARDSLTTGTDWKASTGPVMFDNVYGGESYDAREDEAGWFNAGFNDAEWQKAIVVEAPTDSLRSQLIPPIRRMKTITPVRIFQSASGKWIADLGQNIAGWARIQVRERAGQKITMRFAENLNREGSELDFTSLGHQHTGMIQTNIYVCKGNGLEEWEPRFTYAGFRFIEMDGLSQQPDTKTISGILVHSSVERTGKFVSSDSLLNRIYETSLWTIVDNLHSIPEDCPAREKCGWLGDAHGTAETNLFNFDMALFFKKYMEDIKSQLGRGGETYKMEPATPGIPANISTGKRVCQEARVDWGAAIVLIPYYLYLYDGDIRVFRDLYPNMKDFITYTMRYEDKNGIIQNGYGDWCPPGSNEKMECPPELTSTAFFYQILDILEFMAPKLNDETYAGWCRQKKATVKENFNKVYLRPVDGTEYWTYGSQTGIVSAYRSGLIPEDKMVPVISGLVYDINEKHKGHISTGIHGQRIYSVLCETGHEDLAYRIMTVSSFPSLAYSLSCDLTTWPEVPMKYKDPSVERDASFNHPMNSGFAAFFHECIGGIRPSPDEHGFRHFTVKPDFINQIQWANTEMESPYGKIASNWKNENESFNLEVIVPCNTRATIYIPSVSTDKVYENNQPVCKIQGAKVLGEENGRTILNLGSGIYHFRSVNKKRPEKP